MSGYITTVISLGSAMLYTWFAAAWVCSVYVDGHARLLNPPSRASKWRLGFEMPQADYDDNQGYCGGMNKQWKSFSGKCGVCGDAWSPRPRPHELGGRFYSAGVTRTWRVGQMITAHVDITANHKGWFEFRLCAYDDPSNDDIETDELGQFVEIRQSCLDRNPLQLADGSGVRYYLREPFSNSEERVRLRLPHGLRCRRCLFQWKWNAGNSWGKDLNGTSCIGCGQQETFIACADVEIKEDPLSSNPPLHNRTPNYLPNGTPNPALFPVDPRKMTPKPDGRCCGSRSSPLTTPPASSTGRMPSCVGCYTCYTFYSLLSTWLLLRLYWNFDVTLT